MSTSKKKKERNRKMKEKRRNPVVGSNVVAKIQIKSDPSLVKL